MELPAHIVTALLNPIGHTPQFSASVASIGELLSRSLGVLVRHDQDMNYNPGQALSFDLHGVLRGVDRVAGRRTYRYELRFYVSSRAPLYAVYVMDRRSSQHPVPIGEVPSVVRTQIEEVERLLMSQGFQEVKQAYFGALAPGCLTQLDGIAATVFEALFAEIV